MKSTLLRPALGISSILLVILITYRQTANGSNAPKNTGKMLSVTAATRLSGNKNSTIVVKGLLRKTAGMETVWLLDEDSLSTHPQPYVCSFAAKEVETIQSLPEDTELVIEGRPLENSKTAGLIQCTIISINSGTVYADPFPEH